MSDDTRIWRLPLPAEWEPTDVWCVSFQIPAGDDYQQALSAVLGLLTLPKTFERDDTHTGAAIVAKTWERVLYLNPMSVNENCVVVESPPIADQGAANDASAAIFTQFYQYLVTNLNTCATAPEDCAACVDTLYAELTPYGATEAVRGALTQLCAALNDNPTTRDEYEDDCRYLAQYESLAANINDNPYDWLNNLSDWLFGWLDNTSDTVLDWLNTVGGLMGGGAVGFINDNGGIPSGGGASFGSSCPWTVVFDFTVDAQGWVMDPVDFNPEGVYSSGTGWTTSDGQYPNTKYARQCNIKFDAQGDTEWRAIRVNYDMTRGTPSAEPSDVPFVYISPYYSGANGTLYEVTADGSGQKEWTGEITSGGVYAAICCNILAPEELPLTGSALIVSIEIDGIGARPWE